MAKPFAKQFYNSRQWQACRRQALRRDHYTCVYCQGRAEEVHHIIELTPDNISDPRITLNPDNLISMCGTCHKKETLGVGDVIEGYIFDESGRVVQI